MQAHSAVSSSASHQDFLSSASNRRQMPMAPHYNTPDYGHGHVPSYMNTPPSSTYNAREVSDCHSGWQTHVSTHAVARTHSYGLVESSSYGTSLSGMPRQQNHSRAAPYYPQMENAAYDSQRSPTSMSYSNLPPSPDRYREDSTGTVPSATYPSGYSSYVPLPPSLGSAPSQATSSTEVPCEWDRRCLASLEDSSPSGIARHLRQYHDVSVTDNRNRGVCQWGGRCGKDMFPSSYGKHIAECHLRNMTKQCPHCGADFARADTLTRHIKAFCPNTTSHGAGHSYSST